MSTRALALIALALTAVLAGVGLLTLRTLGWFEEWHDTAFVFENHTLQAARGGRIVLRPLRADAVWDRYTFAVTVTEPDPQDPVFSLPHLRCALERRRPDEDVWRYEPPVRFFSLAQMGATSPREWLVEIRPVLESAPGAERLLLRATYGHESGQTVAYFFDPAQPRPGLGWERQERYASGQEPEVYFATAAAPIVLPPSEPR